MNLLSVLLLVLIGVWLVLAIRHVARHGSCGCGGKCTSCRSDAAGGHTCSGNCAACKKCHMK